MSRMEPETVRIEMPDGRVLTAERERLALAFRGMWHSFEPPTPWRFTLEGLPVSDEEARAVLDESGGSSE